MNRISLPNTQLKEKHRYQVIVIGSGYGGAISASRLARAGMSVCLLERGKEILPGEFPETREQALEALQFDTPDGKIGSATGLYNIHVNREQNVVVGCGLGGTSLINANVSLEPQPEIFDDPRWPQALRADKDTRLKEGFDLARDMLKPTVYPDDYPKLRKMTAHQKSADAMAQQFYRAPINVTFATPENGTNHVGVPQQACNNCGDCVSGCNTGAKNTTQMNYLPDAFNHQADIYCEISVSHIEKSEQGWLVHYHLLENNKDKFEPETRTIGADIVIVAAGTMGSNEIMLRSKHRGLSVSGHLGKGFSGNGDILGFGYNCDDIINGIGFGDRDPSEMAPVGPCITSVIDMRHGDDRTSRMVIEEGSIPGALGKFMTPVLAGADVFMGKDPHRSVAEWLKKEGQKLNSQLFGPYRGAMNRLQTYLIMSHDNAAGELRLKDNRLRIKWKNVGEQPNVLKGNQNLHQATQALGGDYIQNPIWTKLLRHSLVTVHPLGGCNMADSAEQGVVNHKGQVFDSSHGTSVHRGLYISDGSVIPMSIAVNPLLTISAITERCCQYIAADYGQSIQYDFSDQPQRPPVSRDFPTAAQTPGIEFTETMKGYLSAEISGDIDEENTSLYHDAYQLGKQQQQPITFTLTIRSDNLKEMIATSAHKAGITGTVIIPLLSENPLTVEQGSFQLFVTYPKMPNAKHMVYSMIMCSETEERFLFSGYKMIRDDPDSLDIWQDTSTLYVTIRRGTQKDSPVIATGVMQLEAADFLKQMTTMKVLNAPDKQSRLRALTKFGKHFAGALWESYGSIFAKPYRFNPEAPPRQKRPLNAPAPQVHFFNTEDNVTLRLTRYPAGSKGPVMLVHGLGVSSDIFSTDLIDTNLLEFLCAHQYDVWLLDFRVSIDLPAARQQSNGDQVAQYDFPAAVRKIQEETGKDSIQAVVHCWGASTFFMALLSGLTGIRSVVCSQIATDVVVPTATQVKTGLHIPAFLEKLGVDSLTAYVDSHEGWSERLWDKALAVYALAEAQGQCSNPVCHRVTFNYAPLYRHAQLNEALHRNLHELFAEANIGAFQHLAECCRAGFLTDAEGHNRYLPHLERLRLPICFIHGAMNECYLPESTALTYQTLVNRFGPEHYTRHVIPDYGHIDCIFGRNASRDVYPLIVKHLDQTA
ncbi:alpha/beta fold hydrolase [Photobacterium sp. 53610]|uniref:alpha/beta fold hydrolase n=1 Tax=Photobacterium sp. 53610 TaxID=3102789 RepID=UPI002ED77138